MYKQIQNRTNGPSIKLLLIVVAVCFSRVAFSQSNDSDFDAIDYSQLKLPSLETLFENAKKSPAVELYEAKMEEQVSLLKTEKRSWLKYFKVGGNWQYGKVGINSSYSDEYTPLYYTYSGAKQHNYYAAATVSIPLDDLFDRKSKIKRQQLEVKSTQLELAKWHDEQKLKIIELYTKAVKELSVLKLKIEAYTFANAQCQQGEADFLNGQIDAVQLSVIKSRQMSALETLETTKEELNTALLQLEVLSKTKIIK